MSAYPGASTHVLRSIDPRTAESRTRFTVTDVPYPVGGPGECSECPSDAPIKQAVGEVRYRSSIFRSRIHEAVCLPCLPGLLGVLASLHENPLTVALYSPCAGDRSERVQALNAEREDLVWMLAVTPGLESLAKMLQGLFTAYSAQLQRIAEVA